MAYVYSTAYAYAYSIHLKVVNRFDNQAGG